MATLLRVLLTIYTVTSLCDLVLPWSQLLPSDLQVWQQAADAEFEGAGEGDVAFVIVVMALAFLVGAIAHLVSLVGLYLLQIWGLWLFVASLGFLFLLVPFFGPYISPGIQTSLDGLSSMAAGGIIAVCFCTDALKSKRRL